MTEKPEPRPPLNREQFLARSGKLKEDRVPLRDGGAMLVRELTGGERDLIISTQAEAAQTGRPDIQAYHRSLLLCGLVDPDSPEGARRPLLEAADIEQAMANPALDVDAICTRIEELSGLTVDAEELAKADFPATPSGASTSG